jgi:ParB family transcriptional regulator, chromosome partitioning protein
MDFRCERIRLADVDAEDDGYRITTESDNRALARSVASMGMISRPILLDGPPPFRVVSGFRRIAVLSQLGEIDFEASLIDPHTPGLRCAMLAVADNAMQRPLNPIETAHALNLLATEAVDADQLVETAGILGLPAQSAQMDRIRSLSRLAETLRQGILNGALAPNTAMELARLPDADTETMAGLFARLRPSLGKQREILTLCREIAMGEGISVGDLLDHAEIIGILQSDEKDRNRKTADLRRYLRHRRFPFLTRAEADFDDGLRELKLEPGVRLVAPGHFEGRTYHLTLPFQSVDDLKRHHQGLGRMMDHPAMARILDRSLPPED